MGNWRHGKTRQSRRSQRMLSCQRSHPVRAGEIKQTKRL
nr:MAG TPA: hypothetical protein [Caudoviricetes sp.]